MKPEPKKPESWDWNWRCL